MTRKVLGRLMILGFLSVTLLPDAGAAKEEPLGARVFQQHCASCHTGGENRVTPSRPIAGSDKLVSIVILKKYLSAPPGHMPYYENVVKDPKILKALYDYCKSLKKLPVKTATLNME